MTDHHQRCQTANQRALQAETVPQEEQKHEAPAEPIAATTPDQGEQNAAEIEALKRLVALIYRETTLAARQDRNQQRSEAHANNERHKADQVQLQRMARTLAAITQEQRRTNTRLICQQPRSNRHDLAGASVWTGDLLSRIWRDKLLSAAAGAILAIAGLWLATLGIAATSFILRC